MKLFLRKELSAARKGLHPSYRNISSDAIIQKCYAWLLDKDIKSIALYHPIAQEVDILALSELCHKRSITMSLPVESGFAEWRQGDQLQVSRYGIRQPLPDKKLVIPDVIITPLLGFDRSGHRIGYGAGFYDKIFATMPSSIKIGVAYCAQEQPIIPQETHDIKLDLIITELEVIVPNADK